MQLKVKDEVGKKLEEVAEELGLSKAGTISFLVNKWIRDEKAKNDKQ